MHKMFHAQNRISGNPPANVNYGRLYNGYAANDPNLLPTDWVIMDSSYSDEMLGFIGYTDVGGKIKDTGLLHWDSPNTGAINSIGFTARGAGVRYENGAFDAFRQQMRVHQSGLDAGYSLWLTANYNNADSDPFEFGGSNWGASVRPVYIGAGVPPPLVDFNGKLYNVIVVNGVYFCAENWKCTHLNNGTPIPNITDNTEWGNLSTIGMCAPENDEDNV